MPTIEKMGLSYFTLFLKDTNFNTDSINFNDKTVSWDGDLYLLSDKYGSKRDAKKISIQMKSEFKKKSLSNDTSPITLDIEELKNYENDGGIMLLKIEFTSLQQYKIFLKTLYSNELTEIIKDTNKYKTIRCSHCKTSQDFLDKFTSFHKNKKFQITKPISIKEIDTQGKVQNIVINIHGKSKTNLVDLDFFSEDTKLYTKIQETLIPLKETIASIRQDGQIEVKIDEEVIKVPVVYSKSRDNAEFIISSCIKIMPRDRQINIHIDENTSLLDSISALDLMIKLGEAKKAQIGGIHFEINSNVDDVNNLRRKQGYYIKVLELIETLGQDVKSFLISDQRKYSEQINWLIYFYIENKPVLTQVSELSFYKEFRIRDNIYLFIFNKVIGEENIFRARYFNDINLEIEILDGESIHPFTAYAILKPKLLAYMNINFSHFKVEIDKYNDNSDFANNVLSIVLLNFINAYDLKNNPIFLECARYINDINLSELSIKQINEFQIIKRERTLTISEKEIILSLPFDENDNRNIQFECCRNILLDEFARFEQNYKLLGVEEAKFFATWPIVHFLPDETIQRL